MPTNSDGTRPSSVTGRSGGFCELAPLPETSWRFTYTHEWTKGDLVIYDNRNLLHSGTWYDADAHIRIMWRTTVRGNPDPTYAGETCSWVPAEDFRPS